MTARVTPPVRARVITGVKLVMVMKTRVINELITQ